MSAVSSPSCASRTRVVRSGSDRGRSTRATAACDPRLDGIVARDFVGVALDSCAAFSWIQPPVPTVTMILGLREPVSSRTGRLPEDWVGGIGDRHDVVEMPRRHASLDFKLTPLGAYTVLGIPLSELAGGFASLEDLFGRHGAELGDRVRDTADWAGRFDLVESFLVGRAATGPQPTPIVGRAWSLLSASAGRLPIGELAATLGSSPRYLATRFREEIGLTPKKAARVLRFAEVRSRLETEPDRFADIAHDCGYCDQAHLNRDFRELAGTTPTDFLARQSRPPGEPARKVTNVQDGLGVRT